MSEDLKEIKSRILEDEKVEELLMAMGCEHITKKAGQRYEARLPSEFNSNNDRSVQIYLNPNLSSKIRSKGESGLDIYGLVSYIVHKKFLEPEQQSDLPKAKRWICEQLGYNEYIGQNSYSPKPQNRLKWLKEVKRNRKKKRELPSMVNPSYPDSILDQFIILPHSHYLEDGLTGETQKYFQVGYDFLSNRIIFPVHNQFGEIISIKGRTLEESKYKFFYLIHFNKMIELFNWHRALDSILEKKEVIIFEGEKTVMLAHQFGFDNCVAIAGDDLSEWQVKMIKELGTDVNIVLSMDKDKTLEDVKKQSSKFGKTRRVYALFEQNESEEDELFKGKDSPCDKGAETFKKFYETSKLRL